MIGAPTRTILALLVAAHLAACSLGAVYIDGFPVGPESDCVRDFTPSCEQIVDVATRALDAREPDHAPVVVATVHDEDQSVFPAGTSRSGSLMVVVFDLADGTRRAAGAYCGPGEGGAMCWPMSTFNEL